MSSLPTWAHLSIIATVVLLCPVLAFLMAIAVEILVGFLKDAGVPALLVLVALVPSAGGCFVSCGSDRAEAPQSGREPTR